MPYFKDDYLTTNSNATLQNVGPHCDLARDEAPMIPTPMCKLMPLRLRPVKSTMTDGPLAKLSLLLCFRHH